MRVIRSSLRYRKKAADLEKRLKTILKLGEIKKIIVLKNRINILQRTEKVKVS